MTGGRAVPVIYNGTKFRSTLEGRWATVLDHLGFPYEYEPVLFDLPSGRYLPDFRIMGGYTGVEFWIEVKGPVPDTREFKVATEVNLYHAPLIILAGDIPRRHGGGTAWYFDMTADVPVWTMQTPEEAIIRTMFRDQPERPDDLGDGYDDALSAANAAKFEKAGRR